MHCVSNYPCSDESLNLSVIPRLASRYEVPIGLSDHSTDNNAAIMSVALGASIIEKHFTLDRNDEGPDHAASSTAEEFKQLVVDIRRSELMLGHDKKQLQEEEQSMHSISRKSAHASQKIEKGEPLKIEKIKLQRPGAGLAGRPLMMVLGKIAKKTIYPDEKIIGDDFD